MSDQPAWEDVLAWVEADVRRSALLLVPDGTALSAGRPRDARGGVGEPPPLALPDLSELPPVPAAMHERLTRLYDEIDRVSSGIRTALSQAPAAQRLNAAPPPPTSRFIDRHA
jgi:hypothetical protein